LYGRSEVFHAGEFLRRICQALGAAEIAHGLRTASGRDPSLSTVERVEPVIQVKPVSTPSPQRFGLRNFSMWCPMRLAKASNSRLCGTFLYLSERPILKSRPLPRSTKGISFKVCELPLPSSLVQTMSVLSSKLPLPPGSGVSASRLAR